jgi:NADH-quinone oxidoreductase subunit N
MLAYSSIAHAGYLLTALVSNSPAGAAALLFYLLFYTLTTVGAFAVVTAKGRGGERDVTTDDLAGLAESRPLLAFVMAVCMLSLLGFPGTAGFIGKWYILTSATGSGYAVLASVLVLTSVISAGYYLPVIMAMYMKPRLFEAVHADTGLTRGVTATLAAVAAALVFFGFLPNGVPAGHHADGRVRYVPALMEMARSAARTFLPEGIITVHQPPADQ